MGQLTAKIGHCRGNFEVQLTRKGGSPKATIKQILASKNLTMEELLKGSSNKIKSFNRGERVKAKLLRIGDRVAFFDIGGKGEGVVADSAYVEAKNLIESLKTGDEVTAVVIDPENRDGVTLLSLRNAASDEFWKHVQKAYENQDIIEVTVRSVNSSGLVVSYGQETAFIPNSQLSSEAQDKGEDIIGDHLKVKIIDFEPDNSRIVLSERAVSKAAEIKELEKALKNVKEGDKFSGVVTTVTAFGAFVQIHIDVDGQSVPVEGLVHVSEMSWAKVGSPSDVVSEGDEVDVYVLGTEKGKLSLSMKQAGMDPWADIEEKYHPDDKVSGKVVRVSDFGAFVELAPGIEGLIHITKIPPATTLKEGQDVNCYVEEVDKKNQKIALGIVVTTSKPVGYK